MSYLERDTQGVTRVTLEDAFSCLHGPLFTPMPLSLLSSLGSITPVHASPYEAEKPTQF